MAIAVESGKISFHKMTVAELIESYRELSTYLSEVEKLTALRSSMRPVLKNGSPLLGTKVKPKYAGPDGQTWAGRGAMPRWLTAHMKKNKRKLESYRIKPAV